MLHIGEHLKLIIVLCEIIIIVYALLWFPLTAPLGPFIPYANDRI